MKEVEKVGFELTEIEVQVLELASKIDLTLPAMESVELQNAKKAVCNIVTKYPVADIQSVTSKDDKDAANKFIDDLKVYTVPLKKNRAAINKELKSFTKYVLDQYDNLITPLTDIQKSVQSAIDVYSEEFRQKRKNKKMLVFEELCLMHDVELEFKESYINSSSEVIEADIIASKKAIAEAEKNAEILRGYADDKLFRSQFEFDIQNRVSFQSVEHMFDFANTSKENIDTIIENYCISLQNAEFEKEEQASVINKTLIKNNIDSFIFTVKSKDISKEQIVEHLKKLSGILEVE